MGETRGLGSLGLWHGDILVGNAKVQRFRLSADLIYATAPVQSAAVMAFGCGF